MSTGAQRGDFDAPPPAAEPPQDEQRCRDHRCEEVQACPRCGGPAACAYDTCGCDTAVPAAGAADEERLRELPGYFDRLADAARIVANVADSDYGRGHAKGLSSGYRAAADHLRAALDGGTR